MALSLILLYAGPNVALITHYMKKPCAPGADILPNTSTYFLSSDFKQEINARSIDDP